MANNRLFYITIIFAAAGLGLASFLAEVAVTEYERVQVGLLASAYRFCAVFVLMIFVVSTVVREFNDKCMELYLSMPINRALYFIGKVGRLHHLRAGDRGNIFGNDADLRRHRRRAAVVCHPVAGS